jgi:hypothetical protein
MVGQAEEELYRLMRGGGYDTEEEEDEVDGEEVGSEQEIEPENPPLVLESAALDLGSSSSALEWGTSSNPSSSALNADQSATGSGLVPSYIPSEVMGWGNSALQVTEAAISGETGNQEWTIRRERYVRSTRESEMKGGRSPPPKLREENLFTDGDSRPSLKPVYKTKEEKNNWGWGPDEKEEQEETLSSLFDEVNAGTFDAEKKRKRFEPKYEWKGEVQYNSPSEAEEEDKDRDAMESSSSACPRSTREGCLMGASEALNKLTKEKDEDQDDSEWLIIKVSKKTKRESFMVDYCDGDSEDEYQWLEGPHDLQHTSVGDLLDRRRSQSRRNRRKQGHATLRSDQREIDDP